MIQQTKIANLIDWLRGFDQNAVVLSHGLFVIEKQTTYEYGISTPPHQEKEKDYIHPFVSTPNNGPCSSCGKKHSNPIHNYKEKP